MDPVDVVVDEVAAASARLTLSVEGLAEQAIRAASALPAWSRAHVLSHVARNADGLRALLLAARSGRPLRMYASPQTRVADIEAGATRPVDVLIADVAESGERFVVECRAMPQARWDEEVVFTSGGHLPPPTVQARDIVHMRLQELELHHVDLDCGYSFDQVPSSTVDRLLTSAARQRQRQQLRLRLVATDADWLDGPDPSNADAVIEGSRRALLGWLSGRTNGDDLSAYPAMPQLPPLA